MVFGQHIEQLYLFFAAEWLMQQKKLQITFAPSQSSGTRPRKRSTMQGSHNNRFVLTGPRPKFALDAASSCLLIVVSVFAMIAGMVVNSTGKLHKAVNVGQNSA